MNDFLVVGVLLSRVRVEEKLLLAELERRGVEIVRFDDRQFTLDLSAPDPAMSRCDVVLERCINHLRALYTL
ncbi:MAG: 30S ribosomal protein S6--L-glutamate ligase, partial [Chloroflexia bacterium]|nr:30S ribosomal protein S6--L-glutamate ligase [Chloroflexia bacterium]